MKNNAIDIPSFFPFIEKSINKTLLSEAINKEIVSLNRDMTTLSHEQYQKLQDKVQEFVKLYTDQFIKK